MVTLAWEGMLLEVQLVCFEKLYVCARYLVLDEWNGIDLQTRTLSEAAVTGDSLIL